MRIPHFDLLIPCVSINCFTTSTRFLPIARPKSEISFVTWFHLHLYLSSCAWHISDTSLRPASVYFLGTFHLVLCDAGHPSLSLSCHVFADSIFCCFRFSEVLFFFFILADLVFATNTPAFLVCFIFSLQVIFSYCQVFLPNLGFLILFRSVFPCFIYITSFCLACLSILTTFLAISSFLCPKLFAYNFLI